MDDESDNPILAGKYRMGDITDALRRYNETHASETGFEPLSDYKILGLGPTIRILRKEGFLKD